MIELIIGREGKQPFPITDSSVSKQHAKLVVDDEGHLYVEDLNSRNGVFVNDQKVFRKALNPTDVVKLGPIYQLDLSLMIQTLQAIVKQTNAEAPMDAEEVKLAFEALRAVRTQYEKEMLAIKKMEANSRIVRALPAILISVVTVVVRYAMPSNISSSVMLPLGVILVVVIAFTGYKFYKAQSGIPAKEAAVRKKFEIDYVCPNCGVFLGDRPFEQLEKQHKCSKCKINWN